LTILRSLKTRGDEGALIWAAMESDCALVKKFGTAPKRNITDSSF